MWKALQADLAGIDAPNPKHRGLLIEFSATFGQVAEGEHAFDRYAKSVIFDYAYDRFHQDRYGKDFWHVRVQSKEDASVAAQRQTMTAALLSFWHQVASHRSSEAKQAAADFHENVQYQMQTILGEIQFFVNSKVNKSSKISSVEQVAEFEKTASQKIKRYKYDRTGDGKAGGKGQ